MWKLLISYNLLLLGVCAQNLTFLSNFTNKITLPKCCDPNEAFNKDHVCVNTEQLEDYYQVSQINQLNTTETDDYCIDAVVNEVFLETGVYQMNIRTNETHVSTGKKTLRANVLFYPKCCPIWDTYDMKLHRCIPNEDESSDDVSSMFIRTGLAECKGDRHVIVDYLVHINDSLTLHDNKSISYEDTLHGYGNYCLDRTADGSDVIRVCLPRGDVCLKYGERVVESKRKRMRCIRKCCPDGHSYQKLVNNNVCIASFKFGVDITNERFHDSSDIGLSVDDDAEEVEDFAVYSPPLAAAGRYLGLPRTNFHIDKYGRLHIDESKIWEIFQYDQGKYCVEYHNNNMKFFFSRTMDVIPTETALRIHNIILMISIVFVIITLLAYIFLPKMMNLHGKITMSHCISLLFLDCLLIIFKSESVLERTLSENEELCTLFGFSIIYASLSVFCWLNIIGFDIWYNIGSMRVRGMQRKGKELRKFLFYCGYGWIAPLLFTVFAYSAYALNYLPEEATPHIGKFTCYFTRNTGTYDYYIFFFVPFNILLCANLVFFARTIYYCFKVKAEINKMRNAGDEKSTIQKMLNADKERAAMLLKLLIVMGVTWSLEVISIVIENKEASVIMLVLDTVNGLQGVWIFCIYILKRKVYEAVQDLLAMHDIYISKTNSQRIQAPIIFS